MADPAPWPWARLPAVGVHAEAAPPRRPPVRRAWAVVLAVVAFAAIAALAAAVSAEVRNRRDEGFCRADHGLPGVTASDEHVWWPLGERCLLRSSDGSVRVREPTFALTGFLVAAVAALVAGATAPKGTVRRALAWVVGVPAIPLAIAIQLTVSPHSLTRLVALTAVCLGFGSIMATVTALFVWLVMRGRVLTTVLGSWAAWSTLIFVQGRDSIGR